MSNFELGRRALLAAVAAFGLSGPAVADGHQVLDSIHFLIPGGAGGGWDGTARGTGEALTKAGLVGTASYENMSGGGGGKAIGYLIENAESNHGTLMVNSTPIVIRSLTGVLPAELPRPDADRGHHRRLCRNRRRQGQPDQFHGGPGRGL